MVNEKKWSMKKMVNGSKLSFSFHVVSHENTVAVENGIGEELDPVAEDHHTAFIADFAVHLYVTVAEDEVIDLRMGL